MPTSDQPLLLSIRDAAASLAVGVDRVYELVAVGSLPHVRLGERTIRIPRALLEQWILERSQTDTTPH